MTSRSAPRRRRATTGPSIGGNSQTAAPAASDILLSALAAERQAALVGHALRRHQNFLLRRLDLREPHWPLGFEVILHHLSGAFRHVLEDFLLQRLVRRLERNDQLVARHFAQQLLHAAI